jgi:hypothetical protein
MPHADDASRSLHNRVQNMRRAVTAARSLGRFQTIAKADDEDALSDLLANLMHLCDIDGTSFAKELSRATRHYRIEIQEACWPGTDQMKV